MTHKEIMEALLRDEKLTTADWRFNSFCKLNKAGYLIAEDGKTNTYLGEDLFRAGEQENGSYVTIYKAPVKTMNFLEAVKFSSQYNKKVIRFFSLHRPEHAILFRLAIHEFIMQVCLLRTEDFLAEDWVEYREKEDE